MPTFEIITVPQLLDKRPLAGTLVTTVRIPKRYSCLRDKLYNLFACDRKTPGIEDLPRSYRGIIKGLSGHQVKPHRPNFPFGPWIC